MAVAMALMSDRCRMQRAVRRAYNMATSKLRGMDDAFNTFSKNGFINEPFMQVQHGNCSCPCAGIGMCPALSAFTVAFVDLVTCTSALTVFVQAHKHLDWDSFVDALRDWTCADDMRAGDSTDSDGPNCGRAIVDKIPGQDGGRRWSSRAR